MFKIKESICSLENLLDTRIALVFYIFILTHSSYFLLILKPFHVSNKLVRFAHNWNNGMMEYWNDGCLCVSARR